MEKEFVTPEIARQLKELGFNEPCLVYFEPIQEDILSFCVPDTTIFCKRNSEVPEVICMPLWQQAVKYILERLEFYYPYLEFHVFDDESGEWFSPGLDDNEELELDFVSLEDAILKGIKTLQKARTEHGYYLDFNKNIVKI